MKLHYTKWLGLTAIMIIILTGLNSCLKNRANETDFSNLQDFVIFQKGGTGNFSASNVGLSSDTVRKTAIVTLASKNVSTAPLTVTIGIDDSKRTAYNGTNGTTYQALTSTMYKIVNPTVTIPAGQNYTTVTVEFYSKNIDPAVSYLLPLSIVDASGKNLSGNENTVYYNIIGNVLAGNYLHSYYRYNGTNDTTVAPNSTVGINVPITVNPITATTVLLPEYYLEINLGIGVNLTFDNNAGVLSNFRLSLDAATQATLAANSFQVTVLKLVGFKIVGNQSTKFAGSTFRIYLEILNNTGALRTMINNFVKQ